MKYCSRPFNFIWVTRSFDGNEKSMCLPCSWLTIVGEEDTDLTKHSLEEVWQGRTFKMVRDSIRDGSFRYCNCLSCPYISNDTLEELEQEEFAEKTKEMDAPTHFGLAYDRTCNHACPSCRHEIYNCKKSILVENEDIGNKLLPYLNKAEFIDSNGQGDFFASSGNLSLFSRIHPKNKDIEISIETNGTLFDEKHWEKIEHLREYNIVVNITPNSYERMTYSYLNGGFDLLEKLENNLHFVKSLREKGDINHFALVAVVQESNVKEIPSFIQKSIEVYSADEVTVRPIYKWNFMTEEEFWFKNVANPLHPYHQYYEELRNSEIMKHPKVYNWGVMNEEPPQKHPAYRYQEIAEVLSELIQMDDLEKRINQYFEKKNISEIILYGKDTLGEALQKVFARDGVKVSVKEVLAKEMLAGYPLQKEDVVLICNYHFAAPILRDLKFHGFEGTALLADEWIGELKREGVLYG